MIDMRSHRCLQPRRDGEPPMSHDEVDDGKKAALAAAVLTASGVAVSCVAAACLAASVLGL